MNTFRAYKLELWKYLSNFAVDCGNSGIGDSGPLFFNFDVVIQRRKIEDIVREALKEFNIFLVDIIKSILPGASRVEIDFKQV